MKHERATASPDCDSADRWQQSSKKTLFGTCNEMEPALASCRAATLVLETLYSYYMVVHTVRAIQHEGGSRAVVLHCKKNFISCPNVYHFYT